MNDTFRVLQGLRLKGRATAHDLAAAVGVTEAELTPVLTALTAAGQVEEARERLKLTAAGRGELEGLLAEERKTVDPTALTAAYHEFDEHNTALKGLMTRWQLVDGDHPNDHTDAAYDHAVVDDLMVLDREFGPLLARLVGLAPRLAHYPARFGAALDKVQAGDHSWFARPLADSYHTVWFELHEELIGLAGLSRAEEAAAGRAE